MGPGGNLTTNAGSFSFNKFRGQTGVGAVSISNRAAINRSANSCCNKVNYQTAVLVAGDTLPNINGAGMTQYLFNNDESLARISFIGMDFFFYGTNYGNSNGTNAEKSIYINSNYAFGFGSGMSNYTENWPEDYPAVLFSYADYRTSLYASLPQNGTPPTETSGKTTSVKYVRILAEGTNYRSGAVQFYEIFYVRDASYQYMQFNCALEDSTTKIYNIVGNGLYRNTFGSFNNAVPNSSHVLRSDLNGENWEFFPNFHLQL